MAIEIQQLRKSFEGREVLKGLDFVFEEGKVNMIIGASGSGKSVTLKCIVGLLRPDSGRVIFDGQDFFASTYKEVKAIRQNIGMLFQGGALFDSMTVEENVAFPLKMYTDWKPAQIQERVNFCLTRVNLEGANKQLPAALSGGMKKRVGIARAIAMNPRYLFVDEPNSGLDPLTASVIDKLILEITLEYGMTTVVVSHDMNSVMNIGHKIMFIYKGEREWEGTHNNILQTENEHLRKFVFVSDLFKPQA
jgi:phospholipid/cholesterol/gamma-HCH transport system ATP-binding protein